MTDTNNSNSFYVRVEYQTPEQEIELIKRSILEKVRTKKSKECVSNFIDCIVKLVRTQIIDEIRSGPCSHTSEIDTQTDSNITTITNGDGDMYCTNYIPCTVCHGFNKDCSICKGSGQVSAYTMLSGTTP